MSDYYSSIIHTTNYDLQRCHQIQSPYLIHSEIPKLRTLISRVKTLFIQHEFDSENKCFRSHQFISNQIIISPYIHYGCFANWLLSGWRTPLVNRDLFQSLFLFCLKRWKLFPVEFRWESEKLQPNEPQVDHKLMWFW